MNIRVQSYASYNAEHGTRNLQWKNQTFGPVLILGHFILSKLFYCKAFTFFFGKGDQIEFKYMEIQDFNYYGRPSKVGVRSKGSKAEIQLLGLRHWNDFRAWFMFLKKITYKLYQSYIDHHTGPYYEPDIIYHSYINYIVYIIKTI